MNYVTSPYQIMLILFLMSALASIGITTLVNKVHPFSTKVDLIIGAISTVVIFVFSVRAVF